MKIRNKINKKSNIDMLPLIDVVFLLLVFFIYAMLSMAVHKGLNLDLPKAGNLDMKKEALLSVSIKKNGNIYVNKKKIDIKNIGRKLIEEAKNDKKKEILLFADKNISYQKLFNVLEKINFAGFKKISLQAEAKK